MRIDHLGLKVLTVNKLIKAATLSLSLAVLAACSSTPTATGPTAEEIAAQRAADERAAAEAAAQAQQDAWANLASTIYFSFDQATLATDSRDLLDQHAERLIASGDAAVLEGHADERGTREYNIALGERRANSVADYLVLKGVARSQLEVVSYGEERPAVEGSNEFSWAKNRRVEIR